MKLSNFFSIVVFVSCLLLVSCDKDEPATDLDRGTIIGQDFTFCVCCGGWFIDINEERYRFKVIPSSADIDLINAEFPIDVWIDWTPQNNPCLGNEIDVISIELAQ